MLRAGQVSHNAKQTRTERGDGAEDFVVLWSRTSTTKPTSSIEKTIAEFGTVLTKARGEAKVL